jgi:archaemetzincin
MNNRLVYIVLFILFFLPQCKNKPAVAVQNEKEKKQPFIAVSLDIQPFTGMAENAVQFVLREIKNIYPFVTLKNAIPLPINAFYPARNRYRADSIIHFLSRHTSVDHITIGLTNKDISTSKDNYADWGVMGLGFCPGNACVASTFRLKQKNGSINLNQLFKVAIHEAGHTQGLPHCPEKTCFMRDAEGGNPTDEEKGFCKTCKTHLKQRGWKLP